MTEIPVGYMSRGFVEGRARDEAERGALALSTPRVRRAAELRRLAPTQEHPRQCRCDRPLFDQDGDCAKCGLPLVWRSVTEAERSMISELVIQERWAEERRRRKRAAL